MATLLDRQCKTFKMLNKFCDDNKIKLNFLPKLVTDTEKFDESYTENCSVITIGNILIIAK